MPSFFSKSSSSLVFSVPEAPKRLAQANPGAKATMLTWVSACAAPISPRLPTRPARNCFLRVLNKMSLHLAFFVEPIVRAAPRRASDSAGLPDRNEAPPVALERRRRRTNAAVGVQDVSYWSAPSPYDYGRAPPESSGGARR